MVKREKKRKDYKKGETWKDGIIERRKREKSANKTIRKEKSGKAIRKRQ